MRLFSLFVLKTAITIAAAEKTLVDLILQGITHKEHQDQVVASRQTGPYRDPILKSEPLLADFFGGKPGFYHSVASGDPLSDRVVIW